MTSASLDSFNTRRTLRVGKRSYTYFSLKAAERAGLGELSRLPNSLKVLVENLLRHEDGRSVTGDHIRAAGRWLEKRRSSLEIAYRPARVLMQDFTGVPAVVDLAAMRGAMGRLGGDPRRINPLSPVDLVIDHSVMVDSFGTRRAFRDNVEREYRRNAERYAFLRWGATAFDNFRVVPPGTGICHQVNLEYLAQVVWTRRDHGRTYAYPDTLVGTDSHTTMVNGLAVLGWGVGGIEAEAAMLGQPVSMRLPEVVGFELRGKLREGVTATDLVLTVTQMLRAKGVVGKFVEFYGPGLARLSLADRATIANMAPEYGATCGFFPIDRETIDYLKATGRKPSQIALVERYAKAQGMWRTARTPDPVFSDVLALDLGSVEPSLAGPKRPQDRVPLAAAATAFDTALDEDFGRAGGTRRRVPVRGEGFDLGDGDVAIAAITSCTNTSNPGVMIAAGLVARNAVKRGLTVKPWVKTSLAPGSKVVSDYLHRAGLQKDLDKLGFNLVGYGCTTCIGNSGPLADAIAEAVTDHDLVVASVLSGNRNFEGRVSPHVKANYLASPPLVVAYAIAGSMTIDIAGEPLGSDRRGKPVHLRDIWPSDEEVRDTMRKCVSAAMFRRQYRSVFSGDRAWRRIETKPSLTYAWSRRSTYVKEPPYFAAVEGGAPGAGDIRGARVLALLGDSITTDHISPAGAIKSDGPAGDYLTGNKVKLADFNSFGSRRGNHEVMMRGTFANIRLRNEMAPGTEGGVTRHMPGGKRMPIYDAAMKYARSGTPLVVVGGKEYGTGSSRDWAAKGTALLGIKAVIAESFERIHRSNLVGMGVLPLVFSGGDDRRSLGLDGSELFDISGFESGIRPRMKVDCTIVRADGRKTAIELTCLIETADEVAYYENGGILHYVLRNLAPAA
ncbi:MAG: aconitate hydratase AcnA [Alphaproteobacteria bacterium]|nr:aconitate hydratase AcnA [Alphaproteobacteria bacterium]